ncbi:heme-copper oxidase subunit III family protein [Bradyrhizobium diazoefficiens]
MAETALRDTGQVPARLEGWQGISADWASDQRAFKNVSWGKAMMWIFLLSDTFIFSCFLLSYMTARMSTTVPWPNPSEVFALNIGGKHIPLILIAIMTFILISSSGTMAMAVNFGYRRDRVRTAILMLATAAFGATFVSMQAFEWTKLIMEGVRPWGNPWGAAQFGSSFFMITGFHGTHVTIGRDLLDRDRAQGLAGRL